MPIETRVGTLNERDVAEVKFLLPDDVTLKERAKVMEAAYLLAEVLQKIQGIEGPIVVHTKPQE